jgi:predicted dehydrogenase
MDVIRWGMIGCGDVAEVKSGPGFQKASRSALVAVTRRDRDKAEDFARRHGVPRIHSSASALVHDPEVDAVYIATPPGSHCELALEVAAARKPCLVEKPMARNHAQCVQMIDAFHAAGQPLWVAYYRRALPRFQIVRQLIGEGAIGRLTSVDLRVFDRLAVGDEAKAWRFDAAVAGGGLFFDLASHGFDLVDFLLGPITEVSGAAINTGGSYDVEDVTGAVFLVQNGVVGTGTWNFNAHQKSATIVLTGSEGDLSAPIFEDGDVIVTRGGDRQVYPVRNPAHVHQPLIQTIVDELLGSGRCESTGESGARTSWVLDQCVQRYYA